MLTVKKNLVSVVSGSTGPQQPQITYISVATQSNYPQMLETGMLMVVILVFLSAVSPANYMP